jgi:hypothetical protein
MQSASIWKKLTTYEGTCWIFTSSGRRYGGKIREKYSPRGGRTEGSEHVSPYERCFGICFFHCCPLIKSGKQAILKRLAIATVSPF